jgi:hypothetical protein
MKKEKILNNLLKSFGFIVGGMAGVFIGYQLGQLFEGEVYDYFSELSFFLSLFVGSLGCISGFVITTFLLDTKGNR